MAKDKTVNCGTCMVNFATKAQCDNHVCEVTGFTPKDPEHYGTASMRASKEALRRSGSLTKEKEAEIDLRIADAKASGVDARLAERKAQVIKAQREARKR